MTMSATWRIGNRAPRRVRVRAMDMDRGFSVDDYAALLDGLSGRGYRFAAFDETQALLDADVPFVLMRHDVDFDPVNALELARIEHARGIRASYFFMLRTEYYNVFSSDVSGIVRRILDMGHMLGLHFDRAAYSAELSAPVLTAGCAREVDCMQQWFSTSINIVSYHRPDPVDVAVQPPLSSPLPHVYLPLYTNEITYLSDSRGRWRHGYPLEHDAFASRRPMQILTHPIWWSRSKSSPVETLLALERAKIVELRRSMARNCVVYPQASLDG